MATFIHLHTIAELYRLFQPHDHLQHPLIGVVDFSRTNPHMEDGVKISADFYSIMFKHHPQNNIRYGRKPFDFQDGSLICMGPNQVIEMDGAEETPASMVGWGLFFHPDLLRPTTLLDKMKDYTFFSYEMSEALHLSEKERLVLYDCIQKIAAELQENIDNHSQTIIVSTIELLLNYCTRFYGRQFITRKTSNNTVVAQAERLLAAYFQQGDLSEKGLPTVKYLADQVHLSPNYLSDLLKKETGKNAQEQIHYHLIETAKNSLRSTSQSVSEIAYALGFEYPQYFNKLFKQKTGKTPIEFRNAN